MRILVMIWALMLALAGCTGKPSIDDPKLSDRALRIEEFFDGKVVATGQFQDTFGTVRRRFDVDIGGTWDGRTLTLVEDFDYESDEQRTAVIAEYLMFLVHVADRLAFEQMDAESRKLTCA